jgi:cytochrome c peroxidase
VGVPYFAEKGRVDQGRHGGIAALRASPFNLLGRYNDDPAKATAEPTRHVEPQHRNWGEFRVPSLRNVAETAPYMHNGSLATLEAVVRHYSEVDVERLHGDDGGAWCGRCGFLRRRHRIWCASSKPSPARSLRQNDRQGR